MNSKPLDKITKELFDECEKEISIKIENSKKEAEEIINQANYELKKKFESAKEFIQSEITKAYNREISQVELDIFKKKINEKKEAIDLLKKNVYEHLREISKNDRIKILKKLIGRIGESSKSVLVHIANPDYELINLPDNFKKGKKIDSIGGIKAELDDGIIIIDLTYESLLDNYWNENLPEISKKLFL